MSQLTPHHVKELIDQGKEFTLVDARTPNEFHISHLPGAINIPIEHFEDRSSELTGKEHVVVYCNTGNTSSQFVKKAHAQNLAHVMNMVGGMSLRQKEGLEIIKKKNVLPLMRQVLIAAGGLVLLGIGLRYWVNPYFLLLSTFVGGGLLFAGISGFCGMSKLLALMPWNRTETQEKKVDFMSDDGSIRIYQFEDTDLAHYSYALLSQGEMILVDPARDPEEYYTFATKHNAKIVGVIETHPHADFASSHLEIAETTGATIYVSKLVGAEYEHTSFDDGNSFTVGTATVEAINTPGHSPDSISLLVKDSSGKHVAVFTGDTLFIGDVGRADLRESVGNIQQQQEELAKAMFHSTREKLMTLQPQTIVLPAHGSGTLCGKGLSKDNFSTIEKEVSTNPALQPMSEEDFVTYLTSEQPYIPKYFPHSVLHNKKGNISVDEAKKQIKVISKDDIDTSKPIIDTRKSSDYQTSTLPGAINIPLDKQFPTIIGSLYDLDEKVVFLVDTQKEVDQLISYVLKIGYEELPAGIVLMKETTTKKADLKEGTYKILDVRPTSSVEKNPVFSEKITLHIPLHELQERIDEIPEDTIIIPYCGGTYRSSIAQSIVQKKKPKIKIQVFHDELLETLPLHE